MPKPFAVVVLQQHSVRLVGVRINTNLHQAPQDCPRLWNDVFTPRMPELSGKPSKVYEDMVNNGRIAALAMPVVPLEGGEPVVVNGLVIGAVGVSGVKAGEDAQVARAGVSAMTA